MLSIPLSRPQPTTSSLTLNVAIPLILNGGPTILARTQPDRLAAVSKKSKQRSFPQLDCGLNNLGLCRSHCEYSQAYREPRVGNG